MVPSCLSLYQVISISDPVTRLYPFQLASIPVRDTKVDLDTIFLLLRSQPDLLQFFEPNEENKNNDYEEEEGKKNTESPNSFDHNPETILGFLTGNILLGASFLSAFYFAIKSSRK